ncbi:tagatose kinase [Oryzifoliimicrobium ureilyticus]|uniref:tagatose kinase n=1 Tax=Oryzifoliimicrobium ureilyticus TaxID=3113724 RepID=UPI003076009D
MTKILTIGEILVEIVATEKGDGFRQPVPLIGPFPSGAPAIFIDQVGRLGHECAIISAVGNDDFGQVNLTRLRADRVDVTGIHIDMDRPTGSAFVRYRPDGSRAFVFNIRHSACGTIAVSPQGQHLIDTAAHLHVMGSSLIAPSVVDITLTAMRSIKARGGSVSFDPNLRAEILDSPGMRDALSAVLAETDIFLPSGEELFLFAEADTIEDAVEELLQRGIKAVVLKQGEKGASYFHGNGRVTEEGMSVEEVDPTGAGDCFGAAFVTLFLEGATPSHALRYANAAGALAVTKTGPMEGAATRAEIETFLASRSR